ncbi:MAG: autotransporter domain-containing protein [Verrucomicrobiota bacterium]
MKNPWRVAIVCYAAALGATAWAQNRTFTSQYSFGDSLSDNGNLFTLTRQPPPPYVNGRFSNGPTFAELLGQPMVPAAGLSSVGANRNYAYGGATAGVGSPVPNLAQQIASYRLSGLPARSTDLFTVLAGASDLSTALVAPTTPANPATLDAAGASAAQAVATSVQTLVGLGAKNIVVGGLPNLGATPRALATGGAGGAGAALGLRATTAFNNELRARLGTISASAPDVNVVYVDLQGVIDQVIANHQRLGYSNATSYYLAPAAQGGGVGDPNTYVFFDDIHPTAKTHALVAEVVLEQLNPERPLGFTATQGTAALVLAGLATSAIRMDAYASFNYADGRRGRDGWRRGFDYDAHVVTAGVDVRASEGMFVGAAVQAGRMEAKTSGGEFALEDGAGRVYGVWRGGPVSLLLDGTYGTLRVKEIRRATALGGLETSGRTSGTRWGAGVKALWNIDIGSASVRPWLGLRTERVELDGYTERDVAALSMDLAEQEAESSSGAVGVDVALMSRLLHHSARLDFRAAWHGELGSQNRTVAGRLADNFTRPTLLEIEDGDGSGFEIGGAATLFFSQKWGATVGYTTDIRSGDRLAHRATVSVQTGF